MPASAGGHGHAQRDAVFPSKPAATAHPRDPLDEPSQEAQQRQRSRRRSLIQLSVLVLGLVLVAAGFLAVWEPRSAGALPFTLPWQRAAPPQPAQGRRVSLRGSSTVRQPSRGRFNVSAAAPGLEQQVAGLCAAHSAAPGAGAGMLVQCLPQTAPAARGPSPQWGEAGGAARQPAAPLEAYIASLGIPKVALLFLVRGDLPHAQLWGAWFASAAGLLRADCLAAQVCDQGDAQGRLERLRAAAEAQVATGTAGPDPIARQHMFSVYVHAPPDFAGYPRGHAFQGRLIAARIRTQWGQHSLIMATRSLLAAGLEDPLNQRFVLLSETCVPLYAPAPLYAQLLAEPRSRVNACGDHYDPSILERWSDSMEQGVLRKGHFRKNSQWLGLIRAHAEVVANDTEVEDLFARYCRKDTWVPALNKHQNCVSDEHYIPTVLAAMGREGETDCTGMITHVDWSEATPKGADNNWGSHPRHYTGADISPALFRHLRGVYPIFRARSPNAKCDAAAVTAAAPHLFAHLADLAGPAPACRWRAGAAELFTVAMLEPVCPLFARKFQKESAAELLGLAVHNQDLQLVADTADACETLEAGAAQRRRRMQGSVAQRAQGQLSAALWALQTQL